MGGNYRNDNRSRNNFRGGRGRGGGGRGRGGSGRGGGGFRKFNNSGNRGDRDNSRNQWQTNERLSEPEAGITQFISASTKGFQGIIKSRYSDFHVNELDLEGNEAVMTDFALPEAPEEPVDPETDFKAELKEFITEDEIKKIQEILDSESNNSSDGIKFDVTDYDKDKRAKLHRILKTIYGKELFSNTVEEDEKKFIQVKKASKRDKERSHAWRWPHEYTCFILHKENIDTLQAIAALSNKLSMKPALFAYAGTKDKRAKTSQWISVKKMEPLKICQAAKKCQGVRVGNFKFVQETLRLGNLKGNRFRIALRSVKGDNDEIEKTLASLRDVGFINYYGLQRFGNCVKVPTYRIGKALLAGDFKQACELIMQERNGEPYYMTKMRKCYAETKDPKEALETLHSTNTSVEARLLHGLSKHGATNYLQALLNLPRNMLMLYTHAYQSFIWNQISSQRRDLGLEVVEGDLVFTEKTQPESADIIDDVAEAEADDEEEVEKPEAESKFLTMVRHLTAEDVTSGTFTIYDIVLPLPGFDIKYPSNDIGKAYQELMEKDDLSSEKLNSKHPVFSLTGAYRKVFVKPENFSWKFMKYSGQNTDLILSDYSKMFKDPEPEDIPNGENLALILDFVLPSSCYATMALREIMKCDTSVGHQINLESEIKKAENQSGVEKRELTPDDKDEEAVESKKVKVE